MPHSRRIADEVVYGSTGEGVEGRLKGSAVQFSFWEPRRES